MVDIEDILAIEDGDSVTIQRETPAWLAPSAWIRIDAEHAVPKEEWQ